MAEPPDAGQELPRRYGMRVPVELLRPLGRVAGTKPWHQPGTEQVGADDRAIDLPREPPGEPEGKVRPVGMLQPARCGIVEKSPEHVHLR